MEEKISRDRLRTIIESYGSDSARWPAGERDAALRLMQSEPPGSDLDVAMARARELDGWLDAIPAHEPDARLHGRVMRGASRRQSLDLTARLIQWLFPAGIDSHTWIWRPALAAMLPLMVGFFGGVSLTTDATAEEWSNWEEEIYLTRIVALEEGSSDLASEIYVSDEESDQ